MKVDIPNYNYDEELSKEHQHACFTITDGPYKDVSFSFGALRIVEPNSNVDECAMNFEFHLLDKEHMLLRDDLQFQYTVGGILEQILLMTYGDTLDNEDNREDNTEQPVS
jgi:hypothetical protein